MDNLQRGLEVFRKEIRGLQDTLVSLGPTFSHAATLLNLCKGRIITTGVGKSGHIARKAAATFSSTGHPSFYIHPTEANHGDMGMIAATDVLLAISNSGETEELKSVLSYSKRLNIPIIGLTKNKGSTLAAVSTVAIIYPEIEEACPMGLAPTTSTTVCLVICDALAVSIYNDYSHDDFKDRHPGGSLGAKLLKVKDLMHVGCDVPLIDINETIGHAILEMTSKSLGVTGVVDSGKLVGIITDGDLRRNIFKVKMDGKVSEIYKTNPITINKEQFAIDALSLMNDKSITSVFVVDEDDIGIIHLHDCLRAKVDQ